MVGLGRGDTRSAMDRLTRNNSEVAVESRALTTTDGAGGDFVPPLWMVNQYVELARTARPTADRVRNETLPTGTDQVNVPKLSTGTAVAEQSTQNTAVQNTDATTGSVAANVATLAGQQVVAVQLIEQSPINLDTILLADLAADYAAKVDLFVLNNNATNKKGLLQESGTNAITYTSGSPTPALLYSKLADAIQQVTTNRFLPPDTIVMHPRRWASLLAAVDTAGRPLFIASTGQGGFNSLGMQDGVAGGERRGRSGRGPRRDRRPADPDQPRCRHQPGPDHRVPRVGLDPLGGRPARGGVPRDQGRPAVGPAAVLPLRGLHDRPLRQERQCRQRHRPHRSDLLREGSHMADKKSNDPIAVDAPAPSQDRRRSRAAPAGPRPARRGSSTRTAPSRPSAARRQQAGGGRPCRGRFDHPRGAAGDPR
jgi:hypothetical protein